MFQYHCSFGDRTSGERLGGNLVFNNTLLHSQWGIWFIYQGDSYDGNVHLITTLRSLPDVAHFWSQSPIASLSNFFLRDDYKQKTYLFNDSYRRINSIEVFRSGIEPKWEDEQNMKGGRFIFEVPKSLPNKKEVYESFTFFFLGEGFEQSEKVNGFRFVSSKNPTKVCYRIEIWVNFNESDMEALTHYQKLLSQLLSKLNFAVERIQFKEMRGAGEPRPKNEPEGREKAREELRKEERKQV